MGDFMCGAFCDSEQHLSSKQNQILFTVKTADCFAVFLMAAQRQNQPRKRLSLMFLCCIPAVTVQAERRSSKAVFIGKISLLLLKKGINNRTEIMHQCYSV